MLISPNFTRGFLHDAIGFKVEFVAVGFLKQEDIRSDGADRVKCLIESRAVTIKDAVQILTIDAEGGDVVVR